MQPSHDLFDDIEEQYPLAEYEEIADLICFFSDIELPKRVVRLSTGEVIGDPEAFTNSHLETIVNYATLKYGEPYLNRLLKFKSLITSQNPPQP